MDQIKIGKFIAEERKKKNYTQRSLADMLGVSDKTISKWERGNGLPEVSLMLPLCRALDISAGELLLGERISDGEYREKTEELALDLMQEKKENKKKVVLSIITLFITIISAVTIIMCAGHLEMDNAIRIILTAIAIVIMAGGIFVCASLEWNAGTYECPHCNHRFVPTAVEYVKGLHTITRRHLKCPECGKKSMCIRRLTH